MYVQLIGRNASAVKYRLLKVCVAMNAYLLGRSFLSSVEIKNMETARNANFVTGLLTVPDEIWYVVML
jgi:hypothetical protein